MEKFKMFKKAPFVVESLVIVGSFNYYCTLIVIKVIVAQYMPYLIT